uniref:Kinesin-like protein n=1 Tax=Latimeria chalumnae TaxID=7897 RepID=H3ADW2_LATCH|nr:PREDICTED: kinesin-like protein KIFC1 isoform X1 [Latimeria chalumnae]XP_006000998.1 PREDICTED: kinesin-like protein KIFC1 isoform X1 [Latimeria chalumnae]XP_006000999.1 PREDICTED: kinesin-like protein KIFC1 isoform X1 [Latimeria chalumnae]XP_014346896.1 PREDICTED: kinesin-like protein KIFC1 isoform X1 [Latimeria chalumnae]XP_014346897.1 PREDICTED: kinesin-like protein KIFC1 isoform X1 [Latimeria chalumnae]|eukprot:XP_006000997.1 PREDICTED: kinesin-like protein KIFC1 isoform X1 [Latimeria chalumnae]
MSEKVSSRLPVLKLGKKVLREENQQQRSLKRQCDTSPGHDLPKKKMVVSVVLKQSQAMAPIPRNPRGAGGVRSGLTSASTVAGAVSKGMKKPAVTSVAAGNKTGMVPAARAGQKRPGWDLRGQLGDMQGKVAQYKGKLQTLQESEGKLQAQLDSREEENSKLHQRLQELEEENCVLQGVHAENKQLLCQKRQMEMDIESLSQTVEKLQTANRTLTATLESVEASLKAARSDLSDTKETNSRLQQKLAAKERILEEKLHEIAEKNDDLHRCEMEERRLRNLVQELKGNIRVFCRVRPLLSSERNQSERPEHIQFNPHDSKVIVLSRTEESHIGREKRETVRHDFSFDHVFQPAASQGEVFEEISLLVQSSLDGYNVSIFAYGQTGSGKTFTMEGPDNMTFGTTGMIPRAVKQIFAGAEELRAKGWSYEFTASFLEIYNETIRDLLVSKPEKEYEIKRVCNSNEDLYVTNLKYVPVTSEEEVNHLLCMAKTNRSTAKTAINDRSSRSHSVFQLKLQGKNTAKNIQCTSVLSLIDLAGSERLDKSLSTGERLKETQFINSSLCNLSQVISALANKEQHVPYRNSKLTYLLQNGLGGNSKTLMFVNISPVEENFSESLNSLRFASKVNECVIGTARANRKL